MIIINRIGNSFRDNDSANIQWVQMPNIKMNELESYLIKLRLPEVTFLQEIIKQFLDEVVCFI